jgi:hypothetical protein
MPNDVILFCSSDSRPLYIEDIKKAIALPNKYIIMFRYQKKYIDDTLLSEMLENPSHFLNALGIIVFTTGNDLTIQPSNRVLEHHPIRKVIIRKIEDNSDTELMYFYLELGEFCRCKEGESIPQSNKFSVKRSIDLFEKSDFVEVVKRIPHNECTLIHIIDVINCNNNKMSVMTDDNMSSYFNGLVEGERYRLEFAVFSKNENISYDLKYNDSDMLVEEAIIRNLGVTLDKRFHYFKLSCMDDRVNLPVMILSMYCNNEDQLTMDYEISLRYKVKKPLRKALLFGFISLISAIGIYIVSASRFVEGEVYTTCWWALAVGCLFTAVGVGMLYQVFDKK